MFNGAGLLQEKMKDLSLQAQTDPLTGLANRRTMAAAIEKLASAGQSFSLIAVDIDHFKKINDRFGHDAGDFLLQKISILINQSSRSGDLACRTGGEEFLLILPRTTLTQAVEIGERLRLMIESTSFGRVGKVTASLGVSCWPNENKTVQQIIKVADDNLYVAKQNGRNKVVSME
jgi:diguanylate cyclase (GGDEF)-like protein